ncbi:MAG: hypothetical protein IPJ94_17610 [Chloroflexi bacterium]|nr:hypothetical protein [Chloroflexota bacterium]
MNEIGSNIRLLIADDNAATRAATVRCWKLAHTGWTFGKRPTAKSGAARRQRPARRHFDGCADA